MSKYNLDGALGFWMHLSQNKVRSDSEQLFMPYGISPEQWAILVRLWEHDDRTQNELAEVTFRDKPSVSRLIDGLERRGYVLRARNIEDARSHRIVLTQQGRALEAELVPKVKDYVARWTRNIPEEDLKTTRNTLEALYKNLL